jgi:opacity protein-like surface antigen
MKKMLALVLIIALAAGFAQAADNAKPVQKAGSTALMFDLGGLANLSAGAYQGGFGAKYYIANGFAARVSLGFSTSGTTTKNPATTVPATQLSESKETSTSLTIAPGIQYNVATSNAVVGYLGAQVSFTTTSHERTGNANGFGVGFTKDNSFNESSTIFGIAGFIGVEWFPWDNIAFSGEYRAGFSTSSGKVESKNATTSASQDAPSTTAIGLSSGNQAALTVSVFF